VGVTKIAEAPAKPKNCKLDMYASESEVKHPFETVCMLDSKTGTALFDDRTIAGATAQARPQACKCGADAIVITGGRAEGTNFWTNGQGFSVMKAIRYKD